jgi:hypothetical protein
VYKTWAANEFKNATLYVVMSKNNHDNHEYIAIFKKYWIYCPYEIIDEENIINCMQKGAYFMILHGSSTWKDPKKDKDIQYNRDTKESIEYYFTIFTPKTSFLNSFKNDNKKIYTMDLKDIGDFVGRILLKPDDSKEFNFFLPFDSDFFGKEYITTYGPGILKNYLLFF